MAIDCIRPNITPSWEKLITENYMLSNSALLKHLVPILCQFHQDDAALREEVRVRIGKGKKYYAGEDEFYTVGELYHINDLQELNTLCSCARDLFKDLDDGDHQIESLAQISTNILSHLRESKERPIQIGKLFPFTWPAWLYDTLIPALEDIGKSFFPTNNGAFLIVC